MFLYKLSSRLLKRLIATIIPVISVFLPHNLYSHYNLSNYPCLAITDLVEVVLSAATMSPTNHSASSSPSIDSYSSSFPNFNFNNGKSTMYIFNNPSTSDTNTTTPNTNYNCLNKQLAESCQYSQKSSYESSENNNTRITAICKEMSRNDRYANNSNTSINPPNDSSTNHNSFESGASGSSTMHLDSNGDSCAHSSSSDDEEIISSEQKEDLWYLGPGGYSMWRGEGGPGCWVRKMGYAERFMTGSADFGVMSTVYNLWFESKQEVELDIIRRTCYIVAR